MASFDEVVPPGKAGSIRASVHTGNYKGAISKIITVTHDDASQGPINLTVFAKIVGSVEVLPYPALQLARHRRGFSTPAKLIVRKDETEQGELALEGLAVNVPWLKVGSRKVTAEERPDEGLPAAMPGDIILSVQADGAPVGTNVANVTFRTGLPREPLVTIPVTVSVPPIVSMQPNALILTPDPDRPASASGHVLVSVRDDLDPNMVAVSSDAPAFAVRVEPPGERAFRLIVDWSGKGTTPATETMIRLRVGTETTALPVRVNVAKNEAKP